MLSRNFPYLVSALPWFKSGEKTSIHCIYFPLKDALLNQKVRVSIFENGKYRKEDAEIKEIKHYLLK
jgi:hypothetical protein